MIENNNIEIFRGNNPFLSSAITNDNIGVEFDSESANTGDIVCITDMYDELIYRFGSYENAKSIYEFAKSMILDGNYSSYGIGASTPYLNFTVYLEQDITDEGLLSPYAEKWIPGKTYYSGDTVYYSIDGSVENIKTYTLHNCEYYNGYYDADKSKMLYFDEIDENGKLIVDENGNLTHWYMDVTFFSAIGDDGGITGQTESLLCNVMRRKSDMDISGNTLPFILHYNEVPINSNITGITPTQRVLDTATTETFYTCSDCNIQYNTIKNKIVCDELDSVRFFNSEDDEQEPIIFNINDGSSKNTPIMITMDENDNVCAFVDENDLKDISNCNTVGFIYYIDASLKIEDRVWLREDKTGVRYEEIRPFAIKTNEFVIEDQSNIPQTIAYTYIEIGSNTISSEDTNNIDIINSMRDVNYATITVSNKQTHADYFLNVKTFKEDSMMGIQNVNEEVNVNIERGIAESFEKHNMLGEICTMQDLENYKNGKYLK